MGRVSRKIGKEPKKIFLELSTKNLIVRAIITGVCLFLAVILFLNSCTKYINKSTYLTIEYPTLKTINDEERSLFNGNVDIKYFYNKDIEGLPTKAVYEKINTILEDMKDVHIFCDYDDLYKEGEVIIHNLKFINDNPNTWIDVDTSLFNLLKEANNLNIQTNGKYSLFAGRLYTEWDGIFLYTNINKNFDYDPLNNNNSKQLIDSIVTSMNADTTSIEFDDQNKKVKFNVLDSDKKNIALNLGFLENAYYLDKLKEVFIDEGLNSGYIKNTSGMVVTLGANNATGAYLFESKSFQTLFNEHQSTILDYSFQFNGSLNYITFNPMQNPRCNSLNDSYYFYNRDNIYYRSMIINSLTGDSYSQNYSTFTFSSTKTLVSQLIDSYNLFFNDSLTNYDYLTKYEDDETYGLIVSFNDGEKNIAYNGNTTLMYSKLVNKYFKENYIPYIKVSAIVKNKIVATKGE